MLASGITYSLAMALVKLLGSHYSSATENFVRQCMGLLFLLPFILRNPRDAFTLKRPTLMFFRCAATSLSLILAYDSYHALPLAEANALAFTRALFLVPLAAILLREPIDGHKIFAALLGFGGVLVILAPGSSHSLPGMPAAEGLLGAMLVAWSVIGVKSMTSDHSGLALITWSSVLGALFTAPFAMMTWRMPTGFDLLLLAIMGTLGVITQSCYIRGMTLGEASVMGPIDYLRILFSSALGFFMFGDLPEQHTYLGAAIVVAAALYVTLHGRRRDLAQELQRR